MPQQMLAYRASAFFARVHCPDRLMGVQTEDEIIDITAAKDPVIEVGDPLEIDYDFVEVNKMRI